MSSAPPPSTQHKRATFSCHAVPCRDVRKADAHVWNFQLKCIQSKSLTALTSIETLQPELLCNKVSAAWSADFLELEFIASESIESIDFTLAFPHFSHFSREILTNFHVSQQSKSEFQPLPCLHLQSSTSPSDQSPGHLDTKASQQQL